MEKDETITIIECAHCGTGKTPETAVQCGNDCGTTYCDGQCAMAHWVGAQHWELCGKAAGHGGGKWMSKLHLHKGALTKKAKGHHMTVPQYEDWATHHKVSGKTKKQITLAKTFAKSK